MDQAQKRQDEIADAALRVLGLLGARGLTHRAVDAHANLPAGSTSYYCRRRIDLIGLALQRHATLDHLALEGLAAAYEARRGAWGASEDGVAWLAMALHRWMRTQDAVLLAARFELFMAVSREPTLSAVIKQTRQRFGATLAGILSAGGASHCRELTAQVIAYMEGLLLERIRLGRLVVTRSQFLRSLRALLHAHSAPATLGVLAQDSEPPAN
ncbi:MAG: hypothetical protein OXU20_40460 [Myxococcales bacterium]|nr:hypothetical protein [Myxococcales bacterium]MDD9969822.1 hypothetical protein [Myxococcales bacterium]